MPQSAHHKPKPGCAINHLARPTFWLIPTSDTSPDALWRSLDFQSSIYFQTSAVSSVLITPALDMPLSSSRDILVDWTYRTRPGVCGLPAKTNASIASCGEPILASFRRPCLQSLAWLENARMVSARPLPTIPGPVFLLRSGERYWTRKPIPSEILHAKISFLPQMIYWDRSRPVHDRPSSSPAHPFPLPMRLPCLRFFHPSER